MGLTHIRIVGIEPARHFTAHVRPRPSLFRRQRNQAGLFNPARAATPNIPANWNAAPTEDLPVVRYDPRAVQRCLDVMRWGLVPFWAKGIKVGFSNINAKAETVDTKPAFREAFTRRLLLRMEKARQRTAALCGGDGRSAPYGAGQLVGNLAIVGGRARAQLRDCHDRPERSGCRAT